MTRRRALLFLLISALGLGAAGWLIEDVRLLLGGGGLLLLLLVAGVGRWRRKPKRRGPRRTPIPRETRRRIYARDGYTCRYCGRRGRAVRLELDHVFPVARGGGDEIANLVTACQECNRAKGATILGNDRAMARFMAARRDAAESMSRAARRRAFLRNVVAPFGLFVLVALVYLLLSRLVW